MSKQSSFEGFNGDLSYNVLELIFLECGPDQFNNFATISQSISSIVRDASFIRFAFKAYPRLVYCIDRLNLNGALKEATKYGFVDLVEYCESCCSLPYNSSAIYRAAISGNFELIKIYLDKYVNWNRLCAAVINGYNAMKNDRSIDHDFRNREDRFDRKVTFNSIYEMYLIELDTTVQAVSQGDDTVPKRIITLKQGEHTKIDLVYMCAISAQLKDPFLFWDLYHKIIELHINLSESRQIQFTDQKYNTYDSIEYNFWDLALKSSIRGDKSVLDFIIETSTCNSTPWKTIAIISIRIGNIDALRMVIGNYPTVLNETDWSEIHKFRDVVTDAIVNNHLEMVTYIANHYQKEMPIKSIYKIALQYNICSMISLCELKHDMNISIFSDTEVNQILMVQATRGDIKSILNLTEKVSRNIDWYFICIKAIEFGHINIIELAIEHETWMNWNNIIKDASLYGNCNILRHCINTGKIYNISKDTWESIKRNAENRNSHIMVFASRRLKSYRV